MDKNFLIRLNNSLKKIKTSLLLEENIRKMLAVKDYDDNYIPSIEYTKDFIYIRPVITAETAEPYIKHNYISLTITEGEVNTDKTKIGYCLRVTVMSEKESWSYGDNVRPLLLSQQIINILDGKKFDFSNTLSFDSILETVTNDNVYGYSILFNIIDGVMENEYNN